MEEIGRLEKYFERSIAILSKFEPNRITFHRKPKIWTNTVFLKKKGQDYFYIRSKLNDLFAMFPAKGELSKSCISFFLCYFLWDFFVWVFFCMGIFFVWVFFLCAFFLCAFFVRVFFVRVFCASFFGVLRLC